jgi:hypothetical protein
MFAPRRPGPLAATAVLLALASAPAPVDAQPVNDACLAAPAVTSLPYLDVEQTGAATLEPGETQPACTTELAHSVWYSMTPPIDALYSFSTCGSDFDTVIQLYDGQSCTVLTQDAGLCGDDWDLCGPGSTQSTVLARRHGTPLELVHAQVGSKGPVAGTLRFAMQIIPKATNDGCDAARVINHPVFREVQDIADVGSDAADRSTLTDCGVVGTVRLGDSPHSVWYRYTPPVAGPVVIDPTGTNTAVAVAVFEDGPEGCAHLGARVGCQANRPVLFTAVAGQAYLIYVATPTLVPPDTLVFRLTGANQAPVAHAVGPTLAAPGAPVALTAVGSTDPDNDPLTYAWRQTSGPSVALSDPAALVTIFTAPQVTADTPLGFQLTVTDGAAVATAAVVVTVSETAADPDHDGVPLPRDRCPNTPPGEVVDENGCSCSDAGHVPCPGGNDACAPGRCDPATAACVPDPAPSGTPCPDDGNLCTMDVCNGVGACTHPPVQCARACRADGCDPATGQCLGTPLPAGTGCADDGDPCTDDVCDQSGSCTHPPTGSFTGVACRVAALAARVAGHPTVPARPAARLARFIDETRAGIVTAEASAIVGDGRRARHRLAHAARALTRFTRLVLRLEVHRKFSSLDAGPLLDAAQEAALDLAELRATLGGPGRRPRR